MKLATFEATRDRESVTSYGPLVGDAAVLDLPAATRLAGAKDLPVDLLGFIRAGEPALILARSLLASSDARAALIPLDQAHLLAPIPRPAKNVFCVGRNYIDHVAEGYRARSAETKLPEFPQFFTKPPTAVIGPDTPFSYDEALTKVLDYEVELAVIIGVTGKDIGREDALSHVFGYTIGNDITARDLQRRHEQWFKGKGLDRSCPLGPWIVTADTVGDYRDLELSLLVNGERRQNAFARQMIFDIPAIIASLSAGITLEAGDIIMTGTPSGVGYAMTPPRPLQVGDIVECDISRIGRLKTEIVAK
jgi:2-keto-4-pentenoate hydratase/2-oxohepta-3-ene-1,7-dioic acid hydratase in catechol pathway